MDSLNQDLTATALCATRRDESADLLPDDVDALVRDYNKILSSLINSDAPLKTKTLRARPSAPWYNAEIDAARKVVERPKELDVRVNHCLTSIGSRLK